MKNKFGVICMAVGIAVAAAAVPFAMRNSAENSQAAESVHVVLPQLQQAISLNRSAEIAPTAAPHPTATSSTLDIGSYLGILSIPAINLELPIHKEWSETALKSAPCRQFGSVETSDLVIAGHNYTEHFAPIENLSVGETLTLTLANGTTANYKVESIFTADPTAVDEVLHSGSALTLYTCTYSGRERIVVRCERIF